MAVTRRRTGWTLRRVLRRLGLPKARYHDWKKRAARDRLEDARAVGLCYRRVLPEEKEAVIAYALSHPKDGYRRLCWQMVDEDVAYMSPSSVYRILDDADLLYRWKRSTRSGEPPPRPEEPNERWHVDLMYLRVADAWYFLVTVLDAYSRYVVHWELLTSMRAADVRLVVQQALERTGAPSDRERQREPVHGQGLQADGAAVRARAHPDPDVSPRIQRRAGTVPPLDP